MAMNANVRGYRPSTTALNHTKTSEFSTDTMTTVVLVRHISGRQDDVLR